MSREGDEFRSGAYDRFGTAGFGVGEVLGREAAKRQKEILTGAEYSANPAPQGYRPGFDPEYLYFGEPRYEDYAALLPGVYGGVSPTPVAPAPTPVSPAPTPVVPDVGSLPVGTLENLTQADVDNAMSLISSGEYDIYSLADKLKLDRNEAMGVYNQYLKDTYGMGTFNPDVDTLSPEDIQKYYGIADQQGYSPEQLSRIFGIPLDQARSSLAQQYFSGIPVDQDYSTDEAQQVYDLYKSGRMGATAISNYFGIPQDEVQSILNDIEGAEGIAANVGAAPSPTPAPTPTPTPTPVSPLAGIEVDGDYSDSEANQVYDMYMAGQVSPQDISSYFNIPLSEINTALSDIAQSRLPAASSEDITPISTALDLYNAGTEISPEQVRETFEYAQANGISYAELDRMFGAPAGSAQDAAAALGMAASAGGIIGMAKGGRFFDEMGKQTTDEDLDKMFEVLTAKDPTGPMNPLSEEFAERIRLLENEIARITRPRRKAKMIDVPTKGNVFPTDAPPELLKELSDLKESRARALAAQGMAGGGKFDLVGDDIVGYPYGVDQGMQESLELVDKITELENSLPISKDSDKKRMIEIEIDSLKKFGGAVNGISKRNFSNFVEVQKLKNQKDELKKGIMSGVRSLSMADGGKFPDLSGDGEITQEDILMGRGVIEKAEGGYIGRDQLDKLIKMTVDAILGDAENADEIIEEFISVFGDEAFQQLREKVLQGQVPDAQTEGMIEGQGGGMDDEIMGMIGNQQPVAVSPGEYIIPADVVASLGDGSSDAGADKLDTMLDDVRMAKTGRTIQPGKIDDRVIPA